MTNRPRSGWRRRFGGIEWNVLKDGIHVRDREGPLRTPGEPVTMQRILATWGNDIRNIAHISNVPLELLLMTLATEGALQWKNGRFDYPPLREEPGYISDDETPHRISFGPMHVTLQSFRDVMYAPDATREEAMDLTANLLASALYIYRSQRDHDFDPILCAATYNAGGVYDASDQKSKYHSPWHIRAWPGHLDRAARWYGDAVAALAEKPVKTIRIPTTA